MSNVKIAIVYFSRFGHTKLQAEAVRDGAASHPGAEVLLLDAAEATKRIDELDSYDAIVFGTATYMGNIAAGMKSFLEATVTKWGNGKWKDKIAGGFTNSSNFSGDKFNTLVGLFTTAMQLGMIWVGVGDIVGANEPDAESTINGPSPACINRNSASIGPMASSFGVKTPAAPPSGDIETARSYGLRIAQIASRFN
jgi:multimeric flavodoxin WrbA